MQVEGGVMVVLGLLYCDTQYKNRVYYYMPHYSELNENNTVLRVIRSDTKEWCETSLGGTWVRTYYDTEGKNYAGVEFTYHQDKENFSAPQPYPSWTLDDKCIWQPPTPRPIGDNLYNWNEETQSWDEIEV